MGALFSIEGMPMGDSLERARHGLRHFPLIILMMGLSSCTLFTHTYFFFDCRILSRQTAAAMALEDDAYIDNARHARRLVHCRRLMPHKKHFSFAACHYYHYYLPLDAARPRHYTAERVIGSRAAIYWRHAISNAAVIWPPAMDAFVISPRCRAAHAIISRRRHAIATAGFD